MRLCPWADGYESAERPSPTRLARTCNALTLHIASGTADYSCDVLKTRAGGGASAVATFSSRTRVAFVSLVGAAQNEEEGRDATNQESFESPARLCD